MYRARNDHHDGLPVIRPRQSLATSPSSSRQASAAVWHRPDATAYKVILHALAGAEAVFEYPEVFDIGREQKPDVAFGFGPHYCLGASLATLEAETALGVLLARTRRLRRADDAPLPIPPSIVFRGVTSLPTVLEPA